jgi:hypothetical protein
LYKHFSKDIWSVRADAIAKTCLDNNLVNKFFLMFFWADDFYVLTAIAIACSKNNLPMINDKIIAISALSAIYLPPIKAA